MILVGDSFPGAATSLEALAAGLHGVTVGEALWLFPVAGALHVCEEWPRSPVRARRHASAAFTRREYAAIHLALREAVLMPGALLGAVGVAGVFHAAEVRHDVYKAW